MTSGRITAALTLCLWLLGPHQATADVLVSAASSLTDVMTAIARRFEAATRERVLTNFGASNTLARQISSGARVDVFVSADEAQMDRVSNEIAPQTRVALLSNRLAVAVPRGVSGIARPRDLLTPAVRRVAIGDPAAVPAGVYARVYLERIGLWRELQPKIVTAGSVRLALAAVESGAVDAAVVYATDVASASGTTTAFTVPATDGPAIRYPAAVMQNAPNPAGARRFLAFLTSAEARDLFRAAGFGFIAPVTP